MKNLVFSIILDFIYYYVIGLYDGSKKFDVRRILRERCDICLIRLLKINVLVYFNFFICVDKDGIGEFGSFETRKELVKLLFLVY